MGLFQRAGRRFWSGRRTTNDEDGVESAVATDSCAAHQAVAHTLSDDLRTAVFCGFQRGGNVEQIPFTRSITEFSACSTLTISERS
jgi:hypothetical protein